MVLLLASRISVALAVGVTHFLRFKPMYVPFTITTSYFGKQKERSSSLSYGETSPIGMVGRTTAIPVTVTEYAAQVLMVDAKAGTPGARTSYLPRSVHSRVLAHCSSIILIRSYKITSSVCSIHNFKSIHLFHLVVACSRDNYAQAFFAVLLHCLISQEGSLV